MTQARRARQRPTAQRMALCLGLALGLHAVLLLPHHGDSQHSKVTRALQVRMLMPTPAPALAPQPEPTVAEAPAQKQEPAKETALAQTEEATGTTHADASPPELSNPDAPLPEGRGQARVWLAVEADGYVRELRVEPEVLPRAFERAIERGFTGARVRAEPRVLRSGSMCVEVKFREGEPPSWEPVQPAGACVTAA